MKTFPSLEWFVNLDNVLADLEQSRPGISRRMYEFIGCSFGQGTFQILHFIPDRYRDEYEDTVLEDLDAIKLYLEFSEDQILVYLS